MELYWNAGQRALKAGRAEQARPWLDRALPLARELGDPVEHILVSGTVGLQALFTDAFRAAQAAFEEQLRLCRSIPFLNSPPKAWPASRRSRPGKAIRTAPHAYSEPRPRLSRGTPTPI